MAMAKTKIPWRAGHLHLALHGINWIRLAAKWGSTFGLG
jgi:hypothetical protein